MGIGVVESLLNAHHVHQAFGFPNQLIPGIQAGKLQRLRNRIADGHAGIQGRERVLENYLNLIAVVNHLLFVQMGHIFALKANDAVGAFQQMDTGSSQGGLTAARFSHQAHGFPFVDGKRHIVNGMNRTAGCGEILFQVFNFQ